MSEEKSTHIYVRELIKESIGPRFVYVGGRQWEELRGDKEFMKRISFDGEDAFYKYSAIMKLEVIVVEKDDHVNVA